MNWELNVGAPLAREWRSIDLPISESVRAIRNMANVPGKACTALVREHNLFVGYLRVSLDYKIT